MVARIRPNRLEVTDRFPVLGFTLRTDSPPRLAEVVLATDPALFTRREGRTPANFYTSREHGVLTLGGGDAVFVVPAAVLSRFVGAQRLWFGLATAAAPAGRDWTVEVLPTPASPYVTIAALTDRSMRRVRMFPTRTAGGTRALLDWAGDRAQPGMTAAPAPAASPAPAPAPATAPHGDGHYDDGFGPLPPLHPAAAAPEAVPVPVAAPAPAPAAPVAVPATSPKAAPAPGMAQALAETADYRIGDRRGTMNLPPARRLTTVEKLALRSALMVAPLGGPLTALTLAAAPLGISVAVGIAGSAGLTAGAGLSAGIIFDPNGDIGVYAGAEVDVGFIFSASITGQLTLLNGHIDDFAGSATVYGVMVGEELVGGISAIFNATNHFAGVTFSGGVGVGSPISVFAGLQRAVAAGTGLALGATARALDGPETVEIKYRAFIPSPAIKGPPLIGNFAGDGRGFSYAGGTSRGEITFTVEMSDSGAVSNLRIVDRHWCDSHGYADADTAAVPGKPDWWLSLAPGAVPTSTAVCPTNDDTLNAIFGAPGTARNLQTALDPSSLVTVLMSGNNPLVPLSPAIDADVSVFLRRGAHGIEARAQGSHDGFPCHELYVNGHRLWSYDPVRAGNGPTALMPPMDISVNTAWTGVGNAAQAQGLGDEIPLDPGVGGRSIGPNALEVGDLIVTYNAHGWPVSPAIRAITGQDVSHVMMYVDQGGQVIEAIREGVVMRPLAEAMADKTLAVAFRVPGMTATQQQMVADAVASHLDTGFNFFGLGMRGAVRMLSQVCDLLPGDAAASCRQYRGPIGWLLARGERAANNGNARFYCSQLVVQAFADAGVPLTTSLPTQVAPGDIPNLTLRDGVLAYVGHLKAENPPTNFFGMAQGLGAMDAVHGRDAPAPAHAFDAAVGGEFGPGVAVTRRADSKNGRAYDLAQLAGMVMPANALAGGATPPRTPGERIMLDDWPYIDGPSGRSQAPVVIDWAWAGGALGDVVVAAAGGQVLDGWSSAVRADITAGPASPERAALKVRVTTTFSRAHEEDQVAVTDVVLSGDGRHQVSHGGDSAAPAAPAATSSADRQLQPA